MTFRFKAFGLHLAASAAALSLVLLVLYLGWYRWPGWYLTGVLHVVAIMAGVDAALGPALTLLIANPRKPRRELARDIGVIVAVQLVALIYGATTLWMGRPLYYTFSEDRLEIVQASAILPAEVALAERQNAALAPHWYLPVRWVWAPLPEDPDERTRIVTSAIVDGQDVIDMPRYFKPWEQGLHELRRRLKTVDELNIFAPSERRALKERLTALGLPVDQPICLFMTGSDTRLLVAFNPGTLVITAMIPPPPPPRRARH